MAIFKINDRVRILPTPNHSWSDEGVIVGRQPSALDKEYCWVVLPDRQRSHFSIAPFVGCWWCRAADLAPLTDPKADAFLESIRKLKPLHEEPKAPNRRVEIVTFSSATDNEIQKDSKQ